MKKSMLALLLASGVSASHGVDLAGTSYQSGDIVVQGYLYVPSCELNTLSMNGNAVTADGGGFKLAFAEMSGVYWAKANANDVLQEERVNMVIKNCELTQLHVELQARALATSPESGGYRGMMEYLGNDADDGVLDPGTVPDMAWQNDKNVDSETWLYYSVGLGDAKVNGPYIKHLPLKKSGTNMSCTTSEYCLVKLDGSTYTYSNEWRQSKVLSAANVWEGDWTPAESTLDELVNSAKTGYLPSNLVSNSTVIVPMTVRLHHGTSGSQDKMKIPHGDYQSSFTITVRID